MNKLARQLAGYGAASGVALAVDVGILTLLTHSAVLAPVAAATVAFLAGAFVAYAIATRIVFKEHRLANSKTEFAAFLAIGIVGLCINDLVIGVGTGPLGLSVITSKIAAAGLTFACNFTLRRQLLFAPRSPKKQDVSIALDEA